MSGGSSGVPEVPPPRRRPGQGSRLPEPRGGSIWFGAASGALILYIVYMGTLMLIGGPFAWAGSVLAGWGTFIPVVLYLLLAIPLTVRRGTSRFGTGLLIGLGVFTLLGGGLCIGALSQAGA